MSKNPYYDDSDDDASEDFGFDEIETPSVPAPPVVPAPETSGGNSGLPAWAQITSDLADNNDDDDVVVQVPVQVPVPPAYTPPAPATPARPPVATTPPEAFVPVPTPAPAPVPMPVPVPVPEPLRPAPRPPAPPVQPPVPVEEEVFSPDPEPSPPVQRRRREPIPPPTGTNRRKPSEPDYDEPDYDEPDYDDEPVKPKQRTRRREPDPIPEQVTPEPEPEKKSLFSRGGGKKPPKQKAPTGTKQPGRFSGGRGLALALKAVIWIAVGFVILAGCKQIIAPTKIDVGKISQQVQADLSISDFPTAIGEGTALQFARDYLTYDDATRVARTTTLLSYLPVAAQEKPNAPWTNVAGDPTISQKVIAGPFLVQNPTVDGDRATYVVAAQVQQTAPPAIKGETVTPPPATWVYLAVPIVRDETGRAALGGAPGIIPGTLRSAVGAPIDFARDADAEGSLGAELPNFLTAWAASDANGLKRYTSATANPIVSEGLHGSVKYVGSGNLMVETVVTKTDPRQATVDITWSSNGVETTQQYRMVVYQGPDGLWYVEDIEGGGFTSP